MQPNLQPLSGYQHIAAGNVLTRPMVRLIGDGRWPATTLEPSFGLPHIAAIFRPTGNHGHVTA